VSVVYTADQCQVPSITLENAIIIDFGGQDVDPQDLEFRLVDPDPDTANFNAEMYVGSDGVIFSARYGPFGEDPEPGTTSPWCGEFLNATEPGKGYDPSRDFPPTLTFLALTESREYCEVEVPVGVLQSGYFEVDLGGVNNPASHVLYTYVSDAWTKTFFANDRTALLEETPTYDTSLAFTTAAAAALASFYGPPNDRLTVDCVPVSRTSVPPVSTLALMCEPGSVPPGALVTCTVTGGEPSTSILWRASASPAFAGQGVTLDANGSGTFSFRVPTSMAPGAVLVELVEWDRAATVMVTGSVLPSRIPAGEGVPAGRVALLGLGLLGVAALIGRRAMLAS
jgi:hypothetical protein